MKANRSSIGRAVEHADPKLRFYLFLGPDEAQSRALAARLLHSVGAVKFDLPSSALKSNPGLLVDEAAALSLFGERRLIWIEPATKDIEDGVAALLAAEAVESPVAAIAGALPKSSPLLKMAEASPLALAYIAYIPEGAEAARMVADLGRRVGLKIGPSVAARIADACANDQAIMGQELDKLAIYVGASAHAPKDLDHAAVDEVGAESAEGDTLRFADQALLGQTSQLADAFAALPAGGAEAIPVIRSLQRRLLMLAPARARVERGEPLESVMASWGKSLFWKDKGPVEQMLRTWTAEGLATVAERAGSLERQLIFADAPQQEALAEELLTIARKARRIS